MVYDVDFPIIIRSVINRTRYINTICKNQRDYIGMAHNHYSGSCDLSDEDKENFEKDTRARITTIICYANIERDSLVVRTIVK